VRTPGRRRTRDRADRDLQSICPGDIDFRHPQLRDVGASIRVLRQRNGWSQAKLGELVGWGIRAGTLRRRRGTSRCARSFKSYWKKPRTSAARHPGHERLASHPGPFGMKVFDRPNEPVL
jgi:hypothetical protein